MVETDSVHQKRSTRLAAELGPETSGGLGHEPQHERGIVAWRAGAPDGFLDRGDELAEGEVFRAADLEYAAGVAAPPRGEGYRSAPKLAARVVQGGCDLILLAGGVGPVVAAQPPGGGQMGDPLP